MIELAQNVLVRVAIKHNIVVADTDGYLPQYRTNATYTIARQKKQETFNMLLDLTLG